MFSPVVKWSRMKLDTMRRSSSQKKKTQLMLVMSELRQIFLAIDDFLVHSEHIDRVTRKRFWDDFRKLPTLRVDVFDKLLADPNVDQVLSDLVKRRKL